MDVPYLSTCHCRNLQAPLLCFLGPSNRAALFCLLEMDRGLGKSRFAGVKPTESSSGDGPEPMIVS